MKSSKSLLPVSELKHGALALLKVVEFGKRQVKEGKFKEAEVAFDELDLKIKRFKEKSGSDV